VRRRSATWTYLPTGRWAGTDTLFLTEVAGGWRVSAAGCTARPGRPYDCEVSG
jgi:hypothetical protein